MSGRIKEFILRTKGALEPAAALWQRLKGLYKGLARRERLFVSAAGGVVLILILDLAVIAPLSRKVSRLGRQIERAGKDLSEMYLLREEHRRLEATLQGVKPIPKDFSFLHHLESLGAQSGVKIDSIKPGSTTSLGTMKEMIYDVKIGKVSLYQLVDLLYRIERNQEYPMQVKRITIRPQQRDRQFLDVSLQVLTVTMG